MNSLTKFNIITKIYSKLANFITTKKCDSCYGSEYDLYINNFICNMIQMLFHH